MGRVSESIDDRARKFIAAQHLFFVATAPLSSEGLINLSPKGLDSFRVIDDATVAYLDLTGSGVETIAHLRENGRITFMFCAFAGPPNIMRLQGTGSVHLPDSQRFDELVPLFPATAGVRSIISADIKRVSDTCGFAVPLMDFVDDRPMLTDWAGRKSAEELAKYRRETNRESVDGLPGLPTH